MILNTIVYTMMGAMTLMVLYTLYMTVRNDIRQERERKKMKKELGNNK